MISVVIPSYNRAATIERSVNSVLNQTYKDIEVIVVDDCSTDNTFDVVKKLINADNRVRYYKLDKNSGACVARNKGLELAQGEYIAFQDSDDEWLPEKLELQMKAMTKNQADACFCQFTRFNAHGEMVVPNLESGFVPRDVLLAESIVSTQTLIGKKHIFDNVKFDSAMPRLQDYDIVVRLSKNSTFYLLAQPLVNMYEQSDSISTNWEKLKTAMEVLKRKYQEDIKNNKKMDYYLTENLAHSKEKLKTSSIKERTHCFALKSTFTNAKMVLRAVLLRTGLYSLK